MTKLSQAQIAGLAQQAGLIGQSVQIASAIAMAESGGDTNAVNPGHAGDPEYSVGLWQVNIRSHPYTEAQMKDPVQNAAAMAKISSNGTNWNAWGAYTNRSYTAFMQSSVTPVSYTGSGTSTSQVPSAQNTVTNPAVLTDAGSGFKYILAYTVAISIFVIIARFRAGYVAIYYGLVLLLLLLLVTESRFIWNALAPIAPSLQGATP